MTTSAVTLIQGNLPSLGHNAERPSRPAPSAMQDKELLRSPPGPSPGQGGASCGRGPPQLPANLAEQSGVLALHPGSICRMEAPRSQAWQPDNTGAQVLLPPLTHQVARPC